MLPRVGEELLALFQPPGRAIGIRQTSGGVVEHLLGIGVTLLSQERFTEQEPSAGNI